MVNKKGNKHDGRSSDLTLAWLVDNHGQEWEEWRALAYEWLIEQDVGLALKLNAINLFFREYLVSYAQWSSSICVFFEGINGWNASTENLKKAILENTGRSNNRSLVDNLNYISIFIDWVLDTHLSDENDKGVLVRIYSNPLTKQKKKGNRTETVHNPLPYRYICDLRHILCPKPKGHFSDWIWAHKQTGNGSSGGEWFEVDESFIDKADPDCVWRSKIIKRNRNKITIHQIWSPVPSVVLFIKLHLPLRTYQVRMLDSGEADALRYENGEWIENTKHPFALRRRSKGVFRKSVDNAIGLVSTGLYINTNKTADQNKDGLEHGYEIPWQNEVVLYWLEKLRNWQEKYNPITTPTNCMTLLPKHTNCKKSNANLSSMEHICFLMRDASASNQEDKLKPLQSPKLSVAWYQLLTQLEDNLATSGDCLSDGTPLRLVHDYRDYFKHYSNKKKTFFPLHSLRVSLLTSYIMDAKLPLAIVSKLLAGHSRLLMTIYYVKLTPAVMKEKMSEAEQRLEDTAKDNLRTFLKDADMRQIECKVAYNDKNAIEAALVNRNPIGWENRPLGVCLAGGNTARSDELATIAGCWNGGERLATRGSASDVYAAVPHGSENCPRCRWFATEAAFLAALVAHVNLMSYKGFTAANLAVKLEGEIEAMENLKYEAGAEGKPFTQHNELQALQRRYEKQVVESDEYVKDWIATFKLIRSIIEKEKERREGENQSKLIAVGNEHDIKVGFTETNSELLQLALLCDDAEIYPDMLDDLKKTPAIQDRSQIISRVMMRKGYTPQLLMMSDEEQLISANAMMRKMALLANPDDKIDGYNKVANYLELGQFMEDSGLLDAGIDALKGESQQPIKIIPTKMITSDDEQKEPAYES